MFLRKVFNIWDKNSKFLPKNSYYWLTMYKKTEYISLILQPTRN